MAKTSTHHRFSEAKKALLRFRNISGWARKVLTEAGIWMVAGFVYFAMMQFVLWTLAIILV